MDLKRKVYAYITHRNRLLVFDHVHFPEAGTQVPGGTLEPGEDPDAGVMREACEETGLGDLRMGARLGAVDHALPEIGQVHRRHYYHVICDGSPPERWRHDEMDPSDGSPAPITFELYWAPLPSGVPDLIAGLDEMLPRMCRRLGLDEELGKR
jgi:8-oxo-dGTP pyrophosphatase MutT (NUDIX family)